MAAPRPVALFVTGASRGFGRAAALSLSARLGGDAPHIVLLARDEAGLAETRAALAAAQPAARVFTVRADLGDLSALEASWRAAVAQLPADARYARAILVNNSGSVGPVGRLEALADEAASLSAAIALNVTSPMLLTSHFLRFLAERVEGAAEGGAGAALAAAAPPSLVVNVSSLAAVAPFPTNATYCVGKAARDMLHSVLAAENKPGAGGALRVKALSWAPGPMDTALQVEFRTAPALDAGTAAFFADMSAKGSFVRVEDSAALLADVLARDAYDSGAHIDFFDAVKERDGGAEGAAAGAGGK